MGNLGRFVTVIIIIFIIMTIYVLYRFNILPEIITTLVTPVEDGVQSDVLPANNLPSPPLTPPAEIPPPINPNQGQTKPPVPTIPLYSLSILTIGNGSGTIIRSPNSSIYPRGTVITLTAIPNSDSTFVAWSGVINTPNNSSSFTINKDQTLTAIFTRKSTTPPTPTQPVSPTNHSPIVSAGIDQTITLPANTTVGGSATDDGLPSGLLVTSWTKVSGPSNGIVTFGNANAIVTTATFSKAGTYRLRLTAFDAALSTSDEVVINVQAADPEEPPEPPAPPNQTITPTIIRPSGSGFYGMKIKEIKVDGETITITTTGARYVLKNDLLEMWRMIDPETNNENPRRVANLKSASAWGPFTLKSTDDEEVVVESDKALLTFMSDSLFTIKAKQPLNYRHENLIGNAPWNKGVGVNRMWTDGFGGSLHTKVSGVPSATNSGDYSDLQLGISSVMAHMVYPPKRFDFDGLYSNGSRPHVQFLYTYDNITEATPLLDQYASEGFGVIVLFSEYLYDSIDNGQLDNSYPRRLDSGLLGYEFLNPEVIRTFTTLAQNKGFKVITYMYEPGDPRWWKEQNYTTTLEWMRDFQNRYNFNGWYFDGMDAGGFVEDYDFAKTVRHNVGNDGIIYHHNSWETIGTGNDRSTRTNGVQGVYVNAYVNYNLAGETGSGQPGDLAEIDSPDNPYLRFWSSGYGIAQTWGSHKLSDESNLSYYEVQEVMAKLRGSERRTVSNVVIDAWEHNFKPTYNAIKQKYNNGDLNPAPTWP